VGEWLVREFTFLGIHFQNWMPVAAGIVAVTILCIWIKERAR
jgi:disulfide bond formation protein DsbB